jgi:hypothetical protein
MSVVLCFKNFSVVSGITKSNSRNIFHIITNLVYSIGSDFVCLNAVDDNNGNLL